MLYSKDYNMFVVSPKCGYSTFDYLKKKNVVKETELKYLRSPSVKIFVIVRNPISKLESFYKDKFCIQKNAFNQVCQRNILAFVDYKTIRDGDFSFHDFIETMKRGYMDEHIWPFTAQSAYSIYKNRNPSILKFEDPQFSEKLRNLLGIDSLPRLHATHTYDINIDISADDIAFIKRIYKKDFTSFHYGTDVADSV